MKDKKLTVFVVASFVVLAVGSVAAFGFGNFNSDEEAQGFHEQMQLAIENNDFATWKSLMESQLTEENFNKMTEMHAKMSETKDLRDQLRTAIENGDTETAKELKAQLEELMPEGARPLGKAYMKGFRHGFNFAENNLN